MMKKIIELVERYFELDQNPPCKDNSKESAEAREKWADTIWNIEQEIGDRIARRRELEATPITEDWLKEHGWEVFHHYNTHIKDLFQYATKMFGKDKVFWNDEHLLEIFREYDEETYAYADVLIDSVDTLADLLDALELCGITMEDEK